MDIFSPVDNSLVGTIPEMTVANLNEAIDKAFLAQKEWESRPIHERVSLIKKVGELLARRKDDFVKTIVLEIGKPKKDAENEIDRTVDVIEYYADEGARLIGEVLDGNAFPNYKKKKLAIVKRVPLGVVLAITPFNYPVNETAPKLVAALVCGNACVFKPSTQGAVVGIKFANLFHEAGLPRELLPVITGKTEEFSNTLITHPKIAAINFTGSYKVGEEIAKEAGIKKLIMGLSAKDAAIVLSDCDLALTVSEICKGAFSCSGQRCTGIERVFVVHEIADAFLEKLVRHVERTCILGNPFEEKTTLGPVISDRAADYILELIEEARAKGAVVIGGKRDGRLIEATVLDYVTADMRIAWEEAFGPVLSVIRVKDESEGVALVNESEYGLQASIWTSNINKAFSIADKIETGTVQINGMDARSPDHFPFLGVKHSGLGVVGGAKYLIEEMTRLKTTVVNLP